MAMINADACGVILCCFGVSMPRVACTQPYARCCLCSFPLDSSETGS